jgi:F-type H+-transporting ATPase subunit a
MFSPLEQFQVNFLNIQTEYITVLNVANYFTRDFLNMLNLLFSADYVRDSFFFFFVGNDLNFLNFLINSNPFYDSFWIVNLFEKDFVRLINILNPDLLIIWSLCFVLLFYTKAITMGINPYFFSWYAELYQQVLKQFSEIIDLIISQLTTQSAQMLLNIDLYNDDEIFEFVTQSSLFLETFSYLNVIKYSQDIVVISAFKNIEIVNLLFKKNLVIEMNESFFSLVKQFIILDNVIILFLCISLTFFFFLVIGLRHTIIPESWLYSFKLFYLTICRIIGDLLIQKKGKLFFFPILFRLFFCLLIGNLIGLIPYSFALTSHFALTFLLSFIFFYSILFIGIYYHGSQVLNIFLPSDTPLFIIPLLVIIEIISYFARLFSLAIRLFANVTAGHILLKILAWFIFLLSNIFFLSICGFFLISILWVLEFFICISQAYVFLILICIYLNEILVLQH